MFWHRLPWRHFPTRITKESDVQVDCVLWPVSFCRICPGAWLELIKRFYPALLQTSDLVMSLSSIAWMAGILLGLQDDARPRCSGDEAALNKDMKDNRGLAWVAANTVRGRFLVGGASPAMAHPDGG